MCSMGSVELIVCGGVTHFSVSRDKDLIRPIPDRLGSCPGISDMFCSVLSAQQGSIDASMSYRLACFCTKELPLVSLWDNGLNSRNPVDEYINRNAKANNRQIDERRLLSFVPLSGFMCMFQFGFGAKRRTWSMC